MARIRQKPKRWVTCEECNGIGMKRPLEIIKGEPIATECDECDGIGQKPIYWDGEDELT